MSKDAIPVLETERLLLREWRPGDTDVLAAIYAHEAVHSFLGGPHSRAQTEEEVASRTRHWAERGYGQWAVEEKATGTMIGRVGLACIATYGREWIASDDEVEVGWALDPAVWGRGLATEGALASLRYGFETAGLKRIISFTLPHNVASRRVMEKSGLVYQGETTWAGLPHVWYAIDRV